MPLLEAYLDRRFPDWRVHQREAEATPAADAVAMDEHTALEILGLAAGASEAEIKAAHRDLMARLHPDHGGSSYLAAQLNRARDYLLRQVIAGTAKGEVRVQVAAMAPLATKAARARRLKCHHPAG